MELNFDYDVKNPKSIEKYAQKLIGHTFNEVKEWNVPNAIKEGVNTYSNKSRKGGLGNFIEEQFFGYRANSDSSADFAEAGVELKVTPYEIKKSGKPSAGERLVLTMISYEHEIEPEFFNSHLWGKCKLILLIYYLRDKTLPSNMDYRIDYAQLFTPPDTDLKIIIDDYNTIINKVVSGKANELSESDTMYLGACTKGSNAEKSTVPQAYYAPDVKARKRAFCFKNSYMTYVLNNYIVPKENTYIENEHEDENYEPIIKSVEDLNNTTFQDYIIKQIEKYNGKTDKELCSLFSREFNNNKSQWIELAYRMLGIKSNKAEEFQKANIVVKAIRLKEDGKMVESSPLPNWKAKEIINQQWEDSDLYKYFSETKFLFVVFKKNQEKYYLKGAQLWNMPAEDIDTKVRSGWEEVKKIIQDGLILTKKETKSGVIVKNNLPDKKANEVIHVRPHTAKRLYVFEDGSTLGNGTITHTDELPDGRRIPRQSFWINNTYILSQLKPELK